MKVALYARVSTKENEKLQTPENQLLKLREFAKAHGWEIYDEYVDEKSGADPHRPALERMLADARKRMFDAILIVRLDRITRSIINLLNILEDLEAWGVSLICTDQPIETKSSTGKLMIYILAALAEFERELIRERVRDGMRRAVAEGKLVGRRRKVSEKIANKIQEILREKPDITVSELSALTGIKRTTLYGYVSKRDGRIYLNTSNHKKERR